MDNCACCKGISVKVPTEIYNRPGLESISYRIGNHELFKKALISRLTGSRQHVLRKLTSRDSNDFTIALFDAWSVMVDVLTFYQERIANESYLRTSTERLSMLELARLLGYELNPGVAASVYIAFTLEDTPGALSFNQNITSAEIIPPITLEEGIKLQSIPGPGEKAQTFETIEEIEARPQWNEIQPRLYQPQLISSGSDLIYIRGITSGCSKGDIILLYENNTYTLKKIVDIEKNTDDDTTCLLFDEDASVPAYHSPTSLTQGKISDYENNTILDTTVVTDILSKEWYNDDLSVLLKIKNWSEDDLVKSVENLLSDDDNNESGAYVYRRQAFVFGHNAMKITFDTTNNTPLAQSQWTEWDLDESAGNIYLDDSYKEILPDGFISIQSGNTDLSSVKTYSVQDVILQSRTEYGISAKTTWVVFEPSEQWWISNESGTDKLSDIRNTVVFAQSEKIELAEIPIIDTVAGDTITLNGLYLGIKKGQKVIVHGEIIDPAGVISSELKTIKQVVIKKGYTEIQFSKSLYYEYIREELVIYANVALATHGETVEEILGSGNAAKTFQKFTLKNTLLTFVSASTPSGTKSTLEIRVNDILWKNVNTFYGYGPDDRIYVTRIDNEGYTTVIFGDGVTGARLPGGQNNIKAKYRKGLGLDGILKKDQLSQLMTKPLGVKSATNPIESSGGADQENLVNAKKNAALSVLTLDRIVSLQDFEDFARAFAGIEKSLAVWSWRHGRRCIFITVAGPKGVLIKKDSTVYGNLIKALMNSSNPNTHVIVESYRPRYFTLSAKIKIDPEYEANLVITEIESELRSEFAFDKREFGQPVILSEIVSVIHNISGVTAIDMDELYYSDETASLNQELKASMPLPGDETTLSAELLTLDSRPVNLSQML